MQIPQEKARSIANIARKLGRDEARALRVQADGYTIFRLSGLGRAQPLVSFAAWLEPSSNISGDNNAQGYWDFYAIKREDLEPFLQYLHKYNVRYTILNAIEDIRDSYEKGKAIMITEAMIIAKIDPDSKLPDIIKEVIDTLEQSEDIITQTEGESRYILRYRWRISTLPISYSIFNSLVVVNILKIGDLLKRTNKDILKIKGIGPARADMIKDALKQSGFSLSSGLPNDCPKQ